MYEGTSDHKIKRAQDRTKRQEIKELLHLLIIIIIPLLFLLIVRAHLISPTLYLFHGAPESGEWAPFILPVSSIRV